MRASLFAGAGWFCLVWLAEDTELFRSPRGLFWTEGDSWWAPDRGRCAWCGTVLVPMVDEVSACRHCQNCNVFFRHPSLPRTLDEQLRVWNGDNDRRTSVEGSP